VTESARRPDAVPSVARVLAARAFGRVHASPGLQFLVLVGPALAILGAVYLYPLAKLLTMSFGDHPPTVAAYKAFFGSRVYLVVFMRTVRISVVVTALCLIAGYPVGYLLARSRSATVRIVMAAVLVPLWTSILVRSYAWMVLLQNNGVLNGALERLHLIKEPLGLMYNETGVVIGMTQVLLPFAILPIYAALTMIDPRLHAAARIMGAGAWRRFRTITFPLSVPGVAAAVLLVFVQALGYFIIPALLGGSRVITLAMVIESQVVDLLDWPLASAISMVLLVVTCVLMAGFDRTLGLEKVWG
jgi:ABC-type spermidine/putrescine transport system permease subunit I